ncbi:MAG: hypothetical protein R3F14_02585 [Polyangiaceae bacterium]
MSSTDLDLAALGLEGVDLEGVDLEGVDLDGEDEEGEGGDDEAKAAARAEAARERAAAIDAMSARVLEGALAEAHRALVKRGAVLFPMGADASVSTYFEAPRRGRMSKEDFELSAASSPDAFLSAVRAMWEAEGFAEMVPVAEGLREVGRALAEVPEDESGEVSGFVYAMF